ncbi:unnamed protein product [Vicia faba]|uniref:FAD-binding FR-type domain-containing protein n=1 Tax=Vicia faba TaxID=3906 RepID=A0AAV1AQN9_VICFA|nr:unnamed protein product [Vicia faba]
MAVVVDDEDRENEGDLIMEAQLETPEVMAFIVKHGTEDEYQQSYAIFTGSDFGTFSMGAWSEDDEILGVVDDYDTLYFIKFNGEVVAEITKRNLKISSPIVGLFSNNNSYKHESYLFTVITSDGSLQQIGSVMYKTFLLFLKSGMYIFIQCPQISHFQWHPFFLTSGPQDEYPSVHIRTLGDWSYQIYALFQEAVLSGLQGGPKLYIDGPYGSASPNHVKYDILVLIGLGIRATPFISSLRDVTNDVQMSQSDHSGHRECNLTKGLPSKAYLYWVTREQNPFDLLSDVIKEIASSTKQHVRNLIFDVHHAS